MKKHVILTAVGLLLALLLTLCACTEPAVTVVGTHYDAEGNLILEMSDGSTVNGGRYESPAPVDENPQGLDFYPLTDGTYGVAVGKATRLTEIVVPATYQGKPVTKIMEKGFANCKVRRITLPESITAIEKEAFSYSALVDIRLPESLTVIEEKTFQGCELTTVTIPVGIVEIKTDAFRGCDKLIEIENCSELEINLGDPDHRNGGISTSALNIYTPYKGEKKTFTTAEGYVFYADGGYRYLIDYVGNGTDLTLPADCNGQDYQIYQYAFSGNGQLKSVICPEGVTQVWRYAFASCGNLQRVSLPETLCKIGSYAFLNCHSLIELNIPDAVSVVDKDMFFNCKKLIRLENNVFYVDKWAIESQDNEQVLRPDTVGLGTGALTRWSGTTLILPDTLRRIGSYAVAYSDEMCEVVIPASVEYIDDKAFLGCSMLSAVYWGGTEKNDALFAGVGFGEGTVLYLYSEEEPTGEGNYWHYVDGAPTPWQAIADA